MERSARGGLVVHEEEHGRAGFYGPASHLYRLHPPTAWTSADGPAVHRAYDTNRLAGAEDDLWPTLLVGNDQVSIGVQRYRRGRQEFLRDADGDPERLERLPHQV